MARGDPVFLVALLLALGSGSADGDGQLYVKLDRSVDPAKVAAALHQHGADWLGEFSRRTRVHVFSFAGDALPPAIDGVAGQSREPIAATAADLAQHEWGAVNDAAAVGVTGETPVAEPPAVSTTGPVHEDEEYAVTYEECLSSLEGVDATKTIKDPIQWIHIPKAGTSMGAMIYGYMCSRSATPYTNLETGINCTYCGEEGKGLNRGLYWDPKLRNMIPFSDKVRKDGTTHRFAEWYAPYCDWSQTPHPPYSNHFPLSWNMDKQPKTAVVALFRDPRKRLVSAWNNDKHTYGLSKGSPAREEVKAIQHIDEFIKHPAVPGCQVKMMVGRVCADHRPATDELLAEAKKRLAEKLAFVGLTDSFNASVCLFHHMHGGTPKPFMFQTVGKERSSQYLFQHYKDTKKYKPLPGGGDRVSPDTWHSIDQQSDPHDAKLYKYAQELFRQRIAEHNVLPSKK